RDPQGKEGLAELTASALTQGTKDLTAEEFNQKVDFMGSQVSVGSERDYATAGMTCLKKYEDQTLSLLAQVLTTPALHANEIERKRAEIVAAISAQEESPSYVAEVAFQKTLFGADHPYGHPSEGFKDTVAKLTPDDVTKFYHDFYKMNGAVIAVAGDVTADEIKPKLEQAFASLQGAVPQQAAPPAPTVAPGLHPTLIDQNVAQATVVFGFGGVERSNPDYYKLQVMNYILGGGGLTSRLMKVVRSEKGLVYGIGSGFDAGKFPGSFRTILQTKNKSANEAIAATIQQIHLIQEQPVTDDELSQTRKYLVGSFPLKYDTLGKIAGFMLQVELYGLGMDYPERYPSLINAVTKDDVSAGAKKYLHPDAADLIVVANQHEAAIKTDNLEPH
ncbi:MAG TPA: pitrilysin family protein, partial [Candidatus Binataceae bacterium]|nr:pitrilysin family protein [Candidatus Binataceae bacterium]